MRIYKSAMEEVRCNIVKVTYLLTKASEYRFFQTSVKLAQGEKSSPHRWIPHAVQVGRTCSRISLRSSRGQGADLHAGGGDYRRGGVLSGMTSPLLLLGGKLLRDCLHHLQLLRVGEVSRSGRIAQDVRPDVDGGAVDKSFLDILQHLTGYSSECCELWVGLAVLANNLD